MTQKPLVSVVISTYNNKDSIETCIKSILNQSYKRLEIIVVDEWSDDGTAKIAKSLGARVYFFGKERANNRNFGIKKTRGTFLFISDSDMELTKPVVDDCVKTCLKDNCEAVIIPERSVGIGYWAKVRGFERQFTTGETVLGDNAVEAARFFSRKLIKKIGIYDPEMVGAEDWDLHQRILKHGFKIARIKSFLYHHEGRISLSRLLRKKIYYGKAFLEYRRRYPKAFSQSVARMSLLKNIHNFILNPVYGCGVIILKLLEGASLFYGMCLARIGKEYKHY